MKKFCLAVLIGTLSSVAVFGESETWLSIGFEYGSFFEHASDSGITTDSYMASPGIALSTYTFWNRKNVGFFIHDSFLFPTNILTTINGTTTDIDLGIYDLLVQVGIIIGPGFRYSFNKNIKLHYGIGLSFLETVANYSSYSSYYGTTISYSMFAFNFGVGGDIGVKYDVSDIIYLDVGTILNYDFKNYTLISSSFSDASSWSNRNYRMISFRPYICVGFNFYRSKEGLGKPRN